MGTLFHSKKAENPIILAPTLPLISAPLSRHGSRGPNPPPLYSSPHALLHPYPFISIDWSLGLLRFHGIEFTLFLAGHHDLYR